MHRLWMAVALLGCGGSKLNVNWSFVNVNDGYDHENRVEVFVDGKKLAESTSTLQTKPNSLIVKLPKGRHDLEVVNMALYEGKWEPHTVENDYSIDCKWQGVSKPSGTTKVGLLFDINQGTIVQFEDAGK